MVIIIDRNTPTSHLLDIKINDYISDGDSIEGIVNSVLITDTDEFWLFIFELSDSKQIEIRKIKNIC